MSKNIHPIFNFNPLLTAADKLQFASDLAAAVMGGAIDMFQHPEHPQLVGYDYTRDCQCNRMWDQFPIAKFCRGLVWNSMHR